MPDDPIDSSLRQIQQAIADCGVVINVILTMRGNADRMLRPLIGDRRELCQGVERLAAIIEEREE